jgi:HD-GYP domain-containing protein (c-di-GMP phosphodiesterase class II)
VADIYEALRTERPYRPALSQDQVLDIMRLDVGSALCEALFSALEG